jgi:short-subunit dehydrogenase
MPFTGKSIVITGAAGGLGKELTLTFAKKGAAVFAWDINDAALKELSDTSDKWGYEIFTKKIDVTDERQIRDGMRDVLKKRNRLHYWINNVGISGKGSFDSLSLEDFQKIININLGSVVIGTRVALSYFEEQGAGTIINMASIAGIVPAPYLTAYCATKHGVVGFTRALQEELKLKASSVKLVLVNPGFVETPMLDSGSIKFPDWLRWMVASPKTMVDALLIGLEKNRSEIFPTWNGWLLNYSYHWFPQTTKKSSTLLLTRSFRDWLLNRYTVE